MILWPDLNIMKKDEPECGLSPVLKHYCVLLETKNSYKHSSCCHKWSEACKLVQAVGVILVTCVNPLMRHLKHTLSILFHLFKANFPLWHFSAAACSFNLSTTANSTCLFQVDIYSCIYPGAYPSCQWGERRGAPWTGHRTQRETSLPLFSVFSFSLLSPHPLTSHSRWLLLS